MNILVTIPVTEEQKTWLTQAAGNESRIDYILAEEVSTTDLAEVDVIFGNINPELLSAAKNIKLVQLFTAGTDGYLSKIPENCFLTNTTGAFGLAISEHLLAMLLSLQKRLHQYRDNQHKSLWQAMGSVSSIDGATVLVLGLGDIGGEFAKKVKLLGAKTIGLRRTDTNKPDYIDELYLTSELEKVLPRADVVAMALPNTPETQNILSKERIAMLKDGCIVLNVGRGNAIDAEALADAIENRGIRAGLDVTPVEPLPQSSRLWQLENCIITPHCSGYFYLLETQNRMVKIAAENISRLREGRQLINIADRNTGYRANKYDRQN